MSRELPDRQRNKKLMENIRLMSEKAAQRRGREARNRTIAGTPGRNLQRSFGRAALSPPRLITGGTASRALEESPIPAWDVTGNVGEDNTTLSSHGRQQTRDNYARPRQDTRNEKDLPQRAELGSLRRGAEAPADAGEAESVKNARGHAQAAAAAAQGHTEAAGPTKAADGVLRVGQDAPANGGGERNNDSYSKTLSADRNQNIRED